jgi:hypothetical protein
MPPRLRKGKTKTIVDGSRDAALLAVEIYNKPRTTFRTQGFVTLMVIAWTRLFHAYFYRTIGDKYYYKKGGRYEVVDGERKSWELSTCIGKYGKLSQAVEYNLRFFVSLRNKIEHRQITRVELDTILFGECQALLYNYERQLIEWFGAEHVLNESLAFSLQFSALRTEEQKTANKEALSSEVQQIRKFIETYRAGVPGDIYNSQEYSVKLIILPKVSNTSKKDLAVEFVRYDSLTDDEKAEYDRLVALVKDKRVVHEAANVGRLKPSEVTRQVKAARTGDFNQHDHTCFWTVFRIRPRNADIEAGGTDPFETNTSYCHYDEPHNDFVYTQAWVDFIVRVLDEDLLSLTTVRDYYKEEADLDIQKYGG